MSPRTTRTKTWNFQGFLDLVFQTTEIDGAPVGFGSGADTKILMDMSELSFDDERLKKFLKPQDGNEVMDYRFSIGQTAEVDNKTAHAVLIVFRSQPKDHQDAVQILDANLREDGVVVCRLRAYDSTPFMDLLLQILSENNY